MEDITDSEFEVPVAHEDAIVAEAVELNALGLNVIPLQYGSKKPIGPWKMFQTNLLHKNSIPQIFGTARVNLGLMCGAISRNLFVVDCDTKAAFDRVKAELDSKGMKTWVRSSHRGGHFYFLCLDGEIANKVSDGCEIWGNNKYVMLAPSIHPETGEILNCDKPAELPLSVHVSQVPFLKLSIQQYSRSTTNRDKLQLPCKAHKVLVEKDLSEWHNDNSKAEWTAVLSLLGAEYSRSEILELFRLHKPSKYTDKGVAWFTKYVLDAVIALHGANEARHKPSLPIIEDYLSRLNNTLFPGPCGVTDKAVLRAMARRAHLDGNPDDFRASLRETAHLANFTLETTRKAVRRITDSGYISQVIQTGGTQIDAHHYRLNLAAFPETVSEVANSPLDKLHAYSVDAVATGDASNDVWHRSALGQAGLEIFNWLSQNPGKRVSDIDRSLCLSYNTIKNKLNKMKGHGLAYDDNGLWSVAREHSDVDLGKASHQMGTHGLSAKRKDRFVNESQANLSRLVMNQIEREAHRNSVSMKDEKLKASHAMELFPT